MNSSLSKRLKNIRDSKKTNLVFSADISDANKFFEVLEQVGSEICIVKTHVDIIDNFDDSWVAKLLEISKRHNFLILEDRKFADIGSTVKKQYEQGLYRIADWADLITVHGIAGPKVLDALKQVGVAKGRGCLLLAQMSSEANLLNSDYCRSIQAMARDHSDFVLGFISQENLGVEGEFLYFTPGINLNAKKDVLGQQYRDPWSVVFNHGSDFVIVGRDIYGSKDPKESAKNIKEVSWRALTARGDYKRHHDVA